MFLAEFAIFVTLNYSLTVPPEDMPARAESLLALNAKQNSRLARSEKRVYNGNTGNRTDAWRITVPHPRTRKAA